MANNIVTSILLIVVLWFVMCGYPCKNMIKLAVLVFKPVLMGMLSGVCIHPFGALEETSHYNLFSGKFNFQRKKSGELYDASSNVPKGICPIFNSVI